MSTKKDVILDFQLLSTGDPKFIGLVDNSQWGFIKEKPAILEIIVPGSTVATVLEFAKESFTVLNSKNLVQSCATCGLTDLQDGIYRFTLKGSPDTFTKSRSYLKTDLLKLEIDKFLIKYSESDEKRKKQMYELFNEINFVLAVAESHTRQDNLTSAQTFLQRAYDLVDNLVNCS